MLDRLECWASIQAGHQIDARGGRKHCQIKIFSTKIFSTFKLTFGHFRVSDITKLVTYGLLKVWKITQPNV